MPQTTNKALRSNAARGRRASGAKSLACPPARNRSSIPICCRSLNTFIASAPTTRPAFRRRPIRFPSRPRRRQSQPHRQISRQAPRLPGQIDLVWQDNASEETLFKIERKAGALGNWVEIGTVDANVTAFTSTGLAHRTLLLPGSRQQFRRQQRLQQRSQRHHDRRCGQPCRPMALR